MHPYSYLPKVVGDVIQIGRMMFLTISGLAMFFMMLGLTLFLLLEMGVENAGGKKRLVHLFIKHPWKVEALIIILFLSIPISITSITFSAGDYSISWILIAWPVLSYVQHRRFMDFQQTLGLRKKEEYDPVFVAKLSITAWTIAACGLVLSFFLGAFDISQDVSYLLPMPCMIIMFLIPFRKSLALIRDQNTTADDELD